LFVDGLDLPKPSWLDTDVCAKPLLCRFSLIKQPKSPRQHRLVLDFDHKNKWFLRAALILGKEKALTGYKNFKNLSQLTTSGEQLD
jgi:hypothetical protein